MTAAQVHDLQLLDETSLQSVCASPGPFITVYLPARHPGAADLSLAPRLKSVLRSAAGELASRRYRGRLADLFAPFESLLREPAMRHGAGDTVLFGSPEAFHLLRPAAAVTERLVVASHPYITPLLPHILADREFYILTVSRKRLRLGRWRDGACQEIALPPGIPGTLAEAGDYDQPDHDLEGRSLGGPSNGQMDGVRFGTSSDRNRADRYMHSYLRLADGEMARFLRGATLVLAGVADDVAAYRRASQYPHLLEAGVGNVEYLTWLEIGEIAQGTLLAARRVEAESALDEVREANRRDHVASGVREVLEAAHAGRIHKLLLARDAEVHGLLGPLFPIAEAQLEGPQDLLNAAAVETLRAGGKVHIVDPQQLGGFGPIAAILRYSPGHA